MINYYGKFVADLHIKKKSLEDIPQEETFNAIKTLKKSLLLTYFDPRQRSIVGTDACQSNRVSQRTSARFKRWALRLIGYDFDIEYVKTDEFGKADALSRLIDKSRRNSIDFEMKWLLL